MTVTGIIADIGGTNVRFALVEVDGTTHSSLSLLCRDYPTLTDATEAYLASVRPDRRPTRGAFAVASPVAGDQVTMTNHIWSFSIAETRHNLRLDTLDVVNDFIAVALAIPRLAEDDVRKIGGGDVQPQAPMVVIGAGTGLGMASLVWTQTGWLTVSSEGGHRTMPAFDDREAEVIAALRRRHGHVSAERILSGPGLVSLYEAVAEVDGLVPDPDITPPDCTGRGLAGTCPISVSVIDLFSAMMGTVCADMALSLNARGGVYIAGGIIPQLGDAFDRSRFRARFEDKGRFSAYLAAVPTFVVIRPLPAFLGLAGRIIPV